MAANAVQFDKRTYTVDEIQDILGISRTSAYNLVKKKVFHKMCIRDRTNSDQNPLEPRTMQNHFKKVLKNSGITSANYHSLRHTSVSYTHLDVYKRQLSNPASSRIEEHIPIDGGPCRSKPANEGCLLLGLDRGLVQFF